MDFSALQKLIDDDISSNKTPVIVIAFAGNVWHTLAYQVNESYGELLLNGN